MSLSRSAALIGLVFAASCGGRSGLSDLEAARAGGNAGTGPGGTGGRTGGSGGTAAGAGFAGSTGGAAGMLGGTGGAGNASGVAGAGEGGSAGESGSAGHGGDAGSGGAGNDDRVVALVASSGHTCALTDSGGVRCWGGSANGELGYGNTESIGDDETPASVGEVNIGGPVTALAAGISHTCGLLATGSVRCWGHPQGGVLGYGNGDIIGDDEAPASAGDVDVAQTGFVAKLASGDVHNCAVLNAGTVRCWGYGLMGRLGYGNTTSIGDDETPASAGDVDVGSAVADVATGGAHTCALLGGGVVRCWGDGYLLGYGNLDDIGDDEVPASVGNVDIGARVVQLSAGAAHTCALLETGAVRCWGMGAWGVLGYGNENDIGDDETPASAGDVNVGGRVVELAAGARFTCALLASGTVRCWGLAARGELGYANEENIGDDETPASAGDVLIGGPVARLAAGGSHVCALLVSGSVRCWGTGRSGRLGYGNEENIGDNETPASAGDVEVFPSGQ